MKIKCFTINKKTLSNLLHLLNSENCVLVFTLSALIFGLWLIAILLCSLIFLTPK